METTLKNLLNYVQSKEIEQGLDLSKLEGLVDAVVNKYGEGLTIDELTPTARQFAIDTYRANEIQDYGFMGEPEPFNESDEYILDAIRGNGYIYNSNGLILD